MCLGSCGVRESSKNVSVSQSWHLKSFPIKHVSLLDPFGTHQKPGIYLVRLEISLANDEDFGGLMTRSLGFGGEDFLEKLLEEPHEGVVILGAKHFGHEPGAFPHELRRQLRDEGKR